MASSRGRDGGRRGVDGMARGEGEPSTKRAKVDETEEEEDPLVRRKEEVVRLLEEASAKGKGRHSLDWYHWVCDTFERARAREELVTLCARLEAKNEKHFRRLPPELWQKIVDENLHQNDLPALAMTCRFFREKQKDLGLKTETDFRKDHLHELRKSGKMVPHSLGWFQWVCDTFEILPGFKWKRVEGAVYEGHLLNYALYQGSIEILRWLMEDKGWELNYETDWYAGVSGSVEILEYLRLRRLRRGGYFFTMYACSGAAMGGHLKALKFLRGLDPPCPWDERTCSAAAGGGHLEVLKFLRAQHPPCPWVDFTCSLAAKGGHLDVLKWLRDQDPPCPWSEKTCAYAALRGHLEVLKFLRAQHPPCPWDEKTCVWAAEGGHLDVLKWARSQDPPCPWSAGTCAYAAEGGHLEVLKFIRAQDPPCPWDEMTCSEAATGGHLDVLKWARSQDPPGPWSRSACREEASFDGHQHIVDWIDQQEDESDWEEYGEYSDSSDRSYDSYGDEYF